MSKVKPNSRAWSTKSWWNCSTTYTSTNWVSRSPRTVWSPTWLTPRRSSRTSKAPWSATPPNSKTTCSAKLNSTRPPMKTYSAATPNSRPWRTCLKPGSPKYSQPTPTSPVSSKSCCLPSWISSFSSNSSKCCATNTWSAPNSTWFWLTLLTTQSTCSRRARKSPKSWPKMRSTGVRTSGMHCSSPKTSLPLLWKSRCWASWTLTLTHTRPRKTGMFCWAHSTNSTNSSHLKARLSFQTSRNQLQKPPISRTTRCSHSACSTKRNTSVQSTNWVGSPVSRWKAFRSPPTATRSSRWSSLQVPSTPGPVQARSLAIPTFLKWRLAARVPRAMWSSTRATTSLNLLSATL